MRRRVCSLRRFGARRNWRCRRRGRWKGRSGSCWRRGSRPVPSGPWRMRKRLEESASRRVKYRPWSTTSRVRVSRFPSIATSGRSSRTTATSVMVRMRPCVRRGCGSTRVTRRWAFFRRVGGRWCRAAWSRASCFSGSRPPTLSTGCRPCTPTRRSRKERSRSSAASSCRARSSRITGRTGRRGVPIRRRWRTLIGSAAISIASFWPGWRARSLHPRLRRPAAHWRGACHSI